MPEDKKTTHEFSEGAASEVVYGVPDADIIRAKFESTDRPEPEAENEELQREYAGDIMFGEKLGGFEPSFVSECGRKEDISDISRLY